MTTEEKRIKIQEFCVDMKCENCPLNGRVSCVFDPIYGFEINNEDISMAYNIVFPETPHIKDSGERREFDTGAVRDIQEGKGRCDLMPLGVVAEFISKKFDEYYADILFAIADFQVAGFNGCLRRAVESFLELDECSFDGLADMFLEVSKHFEEGAKKYGEHNWQKGIPTKCYIDSAVRHYLKWLRGDKDEPHDRAFVWNILCCIWTCDHKPELNDYGKITENIDSCPICGDVIPEGRQTCPTCERW